MTQEEKISKKSPGIVILAIGLAFLALAILLWLKSLSIEDHHPPAISSDWSSRQAVEPALLAVSRLSGLPGIRLSSLDQLSRPPSVVIDFQYDEKRFFDQLARVLEADRLKVFSRGDLGRPDRIRVSLGRSEPEVILKVNLLEQPREGALLESDGLGEVLKLESKDRARVVLVLDDAGGEGALQWLFLELPLKLNFAVIPGLANSHLFARRALQAGHQVMIHLPMQPLDHEKVEKDGQMLTIGMRENEIRRLLDGALRSVPGAVGLNNHMGSAATSDRSLMRLLMPEIKSRGLIFLDSLTHSGSVAAEEAVRVGLPHLRRDVFLDHLRERKAIEEALGALVKQAREKGFAIGIGHVTSMETWQVLRDQLETYSAAGIEFIGITEL